ncbi:hypothetical protein J6590_075179 [Homalodisca vitripennis]|nr:hypothetical protein J6590_075179 [Homalodisca vitripennis]
MFATNHKFQENKPIGIRVRDKNVFYPTRKASAPGRRDANDVNDVGLLSLVRQRSQPVWAFNRWSSALLACRNLPSFLSVMANGMNIHCRTISRLPTKVQGATGLDQGLYHWEHLTSSTCKRLSLGANFHFRTLCRSTLPDLEESSGVHQGSINEPPFRHLSQSQYEQSRKQMFPKRTSPVTFTMQRNVLNNSAQFRAFVVFSKNAMRNANLSRTDDNSYGIRGFGCLGNTIRFIQPPKECNSIKATATLSNKKNESDCGASQELTIVKDLRVSFPLVVSGEIPPHSGAQRRRLINRKITRYAKTVPPKVTKLVSLALLSCTNQLKSSRPDKSQSVQSVLHIKRIYTDNGVIQQLFLQHYPTTSPNDATDESKRSTTNYGKTEYHSSTELAKAKLRPPDISVDKRRGSIAKYGHR